MSPITRSFENFKQLLTSNLQNASFLSSLKHLSGEMLTKSLHDLFQKVSSQMDTPGIYEKLLEFCKATAEIMPEQKAALESLLQLQDENQKKEALKEWLNGIEIAGYFAKVWKSVVDSESPLEALSPEEKIKQVFETGNSLTAKEMVDATHQQIYRLESQLVRNAIRILFQLVDMAFIKMGYDPVFTTPEERGEGNNEVPMQVNGRTLYVPGSR